MKEDKQEQTPLLAAMRNYIADGAVAFHTPGHKQGKGIHESLKDMITDTGFAMEVSLMEELDDLHEPQTCLKAAQDLAAALYGADSSYFVINGTTGAIQAMILAVVRDGEKLIVPRNAHRSVLGGITLSGAVPVFMQPEIDEELGIAMAVTPKTVEAAIVENPEAKAVLIINPTYYGVTADIQRIAQIVHAHGMVLIVDEAHGPHLKFSDALPVQAMDAGADIVAQSTHKILGAMTQCSMLHARHDRIDVMRLRMVLSLLQSTSPNYLLMASLDVARMQMATEGEKLVGKAVRLANWVRNEINQIEGLYCFGEEKLHRDGAYGLDVTKLTVTVKELGLTGAEAEHILRYTYKIQSELSDIYNVLFIISYADGQREAEILVDALRSLANNHRHALHTAKQKRMVYPAVPKMVMTPREALFAAKEIVDFKTAAGKVSAEAITFYPPGIPMICPGEEMSQDVISYCLMMQQIGLKVVGPDDCSLEKIKIIR